MINAGGATVHTPVYMNGPGKVTNGLDIASGNCDIHLGGFEVMCGEVEIGSNVSVSQGATIGNRVQLSGGVRAEQGALTKSMLPPTAPPTPALRLTLP